MKFYGLIVFFFCWSIVKSQVRFNINEPISTDTARDLGNTVIETKKFQFLSCGVSNTSFPNFQTAYLVKTDSLGSLIWKKQYDFSIGGIDLTRGIIELPDSNYLLLGITTNTVTNDDDVFLAKIDTGGNMLWFQKYIHPDDDEATDFKLTADGKVIILGYTFNSGTSSDILLIKTDIDGNLLWRKRFGTSYQEKYYTIDVINNNEYVLGGNYGYYDGLGDPYFDFSLMRTDTAGNELWQAQYGLPSVNEASNGATPTKDSGFVFCGTYNNYAALLKVDKQGVFQWYKNYSLEQNSYITQVIQLQDSTYAMITSDLDYDNTNRTGYLIKTDKNGDMSWKRIYPHPSTSPGISNYFFGFNTTADKGFIITGQYNHTGQPYQNMWLVKTDSLGCDSAGGCSYLPTNVVSSSEVENCFRVYPNPATSKLKVNINFSGHAELVSASQETLKQVQGDYAIKITDVVGKEVLEENYKEEIDVSFLQQGIYFLSVYKDKELVGTKKIVKE